MRERLLYSGKSLHLYNNLIYYAARSAVSGMAVVGEGGGGQRWLLSRAENVLGVIL